MNPLALSNNSGLNTFNYNTNSSLTTCLLKNSFDFFNQINSTLTNSDVKINLSENNIVELISKPIPILEELEIKAKMDKRIPQYLNGVRPIARELFDLKQSLPDYYVFSHGMSQTQSKIAKFIGEIDHRLWPKRDSKEFIFSRVVPPNKVGISLKDFISKSIDDHKLRSDLLCADADIFNTQSAESALFFYNRNFNIFMDTRWIICDILKKFSQEFNMDFSVNTCQFKDHLKFKYENDLACSHYKDGELGRILAYAVPKKIVHNSETNFVYTSHPGGIPVNSDQPLAKFDELVEVPDIDLGISVRLLTSHLKPENGIKAFLMGDSTPTQCERLQTEEFSTIADNFFQKVVNYCRSSFSKLSEPSKSNFECGRLLQELSSDCLW